MGFLRFLVKLSIVGNAVLSVILLGGSHAWEPEYLIAPHKPVHVERDLTVRMDMSPYWYDIESAMTDWNLAVYHTLDHLLDPPIGSLGDDDPFDAIIRDADYGETFTVELRAHNGQMGAAQVTMPTEEQLSWSARAIVVPQEMSPVDQTVIVVVPRTSLMVTTSEAEVRQWILKHEFGHVLGLADHDTEESPETYHGLMDGTGVDHPLDWEIVDLTHPALWLVADEASCVRLLFDIPGKKICWPVVLDPPY